MKLVSQCVGTKHFIIISLHYYFYVCHITGVTHCTSRSTNYFSQTCTSRVYSMLFALVWNKGRLCISKPYQTSQPELFVSWVSKVNQCSFVMLRHTHTRSVGQYYIYIHHKDGPLWRRGCFQNYMTYNLILSNNPLHRNRITRGWVRKFETTGYFFATKSVGCRHNPEYAVEKILH